MMKDIPSVFVLDILKKIILIRDRVVYSLTLRAPDHGLLSEMCLFLVLFLCVSRRAESQLRYFQRMSAVKTEEEQDIN